MALLRKNTIRSTGSDPVNSLAQPDDFNGCPALWEFLTMTMWEEDGSKRETGTVLVFSDATGLKVMLNDRDSRKVAFAVVDAETGLLASLEGMLTSVTTDWRASKDARGAKGK